MTETAKLLDEAQSRLGLTSDNSLAKALGWRQGTVSNYRTGQRRMDLDQALIFEEKTGISMARIARAARIDREIETRQTVARKAA